MGADFLGYQVATNPVANTGKRKQASRRINGHPRVKIDPKKVNQYAHANDWISKKGKIKHREYFHSFDVLEIVRNYKSCLNGFLNYFAYASNIAQLGKLYYIATYALLKYPGTKV
ncbi:group II intron reverse transcriptase/maturase [Candidatus Phytoplasma pini]|uniref:Putative retron-type reverse transcriptase n=1 Tax=Candidatus Phytoplasma pini TaxID=267362 RepID=A0A559KJ80_9MOLU|nr:putative retron-type reverse transcriptase [Candidatus Phytoplasma pini]